MISKSYFLFWLTVLEEKLCIYKNIYMYIYISDTFVLSIIEVYKRNTYK